MADQTHPGPRIEPRRPSAPAPQPGRGWLRFAAVMFLIAAAVNVLYGISALVNDDYFRADELLFGDLSMWAAILLGFAAVQAGIGLLILRRSAVGVIAGSVLATLHAFVTLASIGAYPVWSVVMLTIDGLIVYALAVHGTSEQAYFS